MRQRYRLSSVDPQSRVSIGGCSRRKSSKNGPARETRHRDRSASAWPGELSSPRLGVLSRRGPCRCRRRKPVESSRPTCCRCGTGGLTAGQLGDSLVGDWRQCDLKRWDGASVFAGVCKHTCVYEGRMRTSRHSKACRCFSNNFGVDSLRPSNSCSDSWFRLLGDGASSIDLLGSFSALESVCGRAQADAAPALSFLRIFAISASAFFSSSDSVSLPPRASTYSLM